jgi:hypothetical protein
VGGTARGTVHSDLDVGAQHRDRAAFSIASTPGRGPGGRSSFTGPLTLAALAWDHLGQS